METKFKFSLVVATLNRKTELQMFLDSITNQTLDRLLFEVIIVDQNENDLINEVINTYSNHLNIEYIKSNRKGLSYNRNIGLKRAKGEYIAVPDDDCVYYPDTLEKALTQLSTFSFPDMIIGRVYDRNLGRYIFKKTPEYSIKIEQDNFYSVVSSITFFFRKSDIKFDEDFGIGEKYCSNEDGDLILSILEKGGKVIYSPLIEFNHPPYDSKTMGLEKLYKYGIGFGAMCRKHFSVLILILFLKVLVFQFLMLCKETLVFNFYLAKRRRVALSGRLNGFFLYKNKKN